MALLHLSPAIQEQILMGDIPRVYQVSEAAIRPLLKEPFWPRQEEPLANGAIVRRDTPLLIDAPRVAAVTRTLQTDIRRVAFNQACGFIRSSDVHNAGDERRRLSRYSSPSRRPLYPMVRH